MRFELTTLTLARLCSTPELRPHSVSVDVIYKSWRAAARGKTRFGELPCFVRYAVLGTFGGAERWLALGG